MESLLLAINVVLPVFMLIGLGYGLVKKDIVSKQSFTQMNKAIFNIFLPSSMMLSILESDLTQALNMRLFLFAVIGLIGSIVLSMLLIARYETDRRKRASIVQGIYRSNFLLFGVPIIQSIYGEAKLSVVALFIACVIPVLNLLAVLVLQYYRGGSFQIKETCAGIITNPLILASALGFLLVYFQVSLPQFALTTLQSVGKIATPLALIALGGSMQFRSLSKNKKQLIVITIGKLIVLPLLASLAGIALGFKGIELVTLTMLFGSPSAVASFTMAEVMDADCELAGQGILTTTLCSVVTVFLFIFGFNSAGLI